MWCNAFCFTLFSKIMWFRGMVLWTLFIYPEHNFCSAKFLHWYPKTLYSFTAPENLLSHYLFIYLFMRTLKIFLKALCINLAFDRKFLIITVVVVIDDFQLHLYNSLFCLLILWFIWNLLWQVNICLLLCCYVFFRKPKILRKLKLQCKHTFIDS